MDAVYAIGAVLVAEVVVVSGIPVLHIVQFVVNTPLERHRIAVPLGVFPFPSS